MLKLKMFSVILAFIGLSVSMQAQNPSGTCGGEGDGSNLTWELNLDDSTLTISGSGDMADYVYFGSPWTSYYLDFKILVIGSSVTSIGSYAFSSCINLTTIINKSIIPPTLGADAFFHTPTRIPVYVPCQSTDDYRNSSWGDFNIIGIGDLPQQELCMISVTPENHNEIIYIKQPNTTSYNIYREGDNNDQYDLIATLPHTSPNTYIDTESNAKVRSYSYKVSAVGGDCNNESTLSYAHKTMHLTINAGQNNSWNLIWTPYDGISYSSYNIYRSSGDSINTWTLIGTMSSANTTYSDFAAPAGYVYYMVEIVLPQPCELTKSISSIKSNIASNNPNVGITSTNPTAIQLYPNPAKNQLIIDSPTEANIEIYNMVGQKLMSLRTLGTYTTIDISHLSKGVYYIKMNSTTAKFLKD